MRRGAAALLAMLALGSCESWRYPGDVDRSWVKSFSGRLPATVGAADAVVVGKMVCTLSDKGRAISLFRVSEILKGDDLVARAMAPFPEAAGSVTVAYNSPPDEEGRRKPRGKILLFMTAPAVIGKNMHLVGDLPGEGMIYALPSLVRRTRVLCGSREGAEGGNEMDRRTVLPYEERVEE